MLKKSAIALAIVLAVLIGVIAMQPATFHVERTITTAAPASAVFAQINDFHRWGAWSPWEKLDPGMQKKYDGAPAGVGAHYSWIGTDKVGEGAMTIEDVKPAEMVKIKLEFLKPFTATNTVTFNIKPSGKDTSVTWSMDGDNNFMAKAFHLFMDMDKMMGPDFEKGLAGIKVAAEADVAKQAEEARKKAAELAAAATAAAAAVPPAAAPQ